MDNILIVVNFEVFLSSHFSKLVLDGKACCLHCRGPHCHHVSARFLLPVTELPTKSGFKYYIIFLSHMNNVEVGSSQVGSKDE